MAKGPQINYLLTYNSTDGLDFSNRVNHNYSLLNLLDRQSWINRIFTGKK